MTYKVNPAAFRLGHSISWSLINSPMYFKISFRLNIMLNTYIKGFLKLHKIRLVKWVIFNETLYSKLLLLVFYRIKSVYKKSKRWTNKKIFANWNKWYFDKVSYFLKKLHKFFIFKKKYNKSVFLGSGRLWHAYFSTLFFKLSRFDGKIFDVTTTYKKKDLPIEFLQNNRIPSLVLKRNYMLKKFWQFTANYPHNDFYIKMLVATLFIYNSYLKSKSFNSHEFLKTLIVLKYVLKNMQVFKINLPKSVFNKFNMASYDSMQKQIEDGRTRLDSIKCINGSAVIWKGQGEISKKKLKLKHFNDTSQMLFLTGFYLKRSFKKIIRRRIIGLFLKKNRVRTRLFNIIVKNLVVSKNFVVGKYIKLSNFFSNKKNKQIIIFLFNELLRSKNNGVFNKIFFIFYKLIKNAKFNNKNYSGYIAKSNINTKYFRTRFFFSKNFNFEKNNTQLNIYNLKKIIILVLVKYILQKYVNKFNVNYIQNKQNNSDEKFFKNKPKKKNLDKSSISSLIFFSILKAFLLYNYSNFLVQFKLKRFFILVKNVLKFIYGLNIYKQYILYLNKDIFNRVLKKNTKNINSGIKYRKYFHKQFSNNFKRNLKYRNLKYFFWSILVKAFLKMFFFFKNKINLKVYYEVKNLLKKKSAFFWRSYLKTHKNYYLRYNFFSAPKKNIKYIKRINKNIRPIQIWSLRYNFFSAPKKNIKYIKRINKNIRPIQKIEINKNIKLDEVHFSDFKLIKFFKDKNNILFLLKVIFIKDIFLFFDMKKQIQPLYNKAYFCFTRNKILFYNLEYKELFFELKKYIKKNFKELNCTFKQHLIMINSIFFLRKENYLILYNKILKNLRLLHFLLYNLKIYKVLCKKFLSFFKYQLKVSYGFIKVKKRFIKKFNNFEVKLNLLIPNKRVNFYRKFFFFNNLLYPTKKAHLKKLDLMFLYKLKAERVLKKLKTDWKFSVYKKKRTTKSFFQKRRFSMGIQDLINKSIVLPKFTIYTVKKKSKKNNKFFTKIDYIIKNFFLNTKDPKLLQIEYFLKSFKINNFSLKTFKKFLNMFKNKFYKFKKRHFLSKKRNFKRSLKIRVFNRNIGKYKYWYFLKRSNNIETMQRILNMNNLNDEYIRILENKFRNIINVRVNKRKNKIRVKSRKVNYLFYNKFFNPLSLLLNQIQQSHNKAEIQKFKLQYRLKFKALVQRVKKGVKMLNLRKRRVIFIAAKNNKKILNKFFYRKVRASLFDIQKFHKTMHIKHKFMKNDWIKTLYSWKLWKHKSFSLYPKNYNFIEKNKNIFLFKYFDDIKKKRSYSNLWSLNKHIYFSKIRWTRLKTKRVKRIDDRYVTIFPLRKKRIISWWRYKLLFNKIWLYFSPRSFRYINYRKKNFLFRASYSYRFFNYNKLLGGYLDIAKKNFETAYSRFKRRIFKAYSSLTYSKFIQYKFTSHYNWFFALNIIYYKSNLISKFYVIYKYLYEKLMYKLIKKKKNSHNNFKLHTMKNVLSIYKNLYLFLGLNFKINFKKQSLNIYKLEKVEKKKKLVSDYSILDLSKFAVFSLYKKSLEKYIKKKKILNTFILNLITAINYFLSKTKNSKKIIQVTAIKQKIYFKFFLLQNIFTDYIIFKVNRFNKFLFLKISKITFYYIFFKIYLLSISCINKYYTFLKEYDMINFLKKKQFYFWMEQQIEKDVNLNVKLSIVNSIKLLVNLQYRTKIFNYFKFVGTLNKANKLFGRKGKSIFVDLMLIFIISIIYSSSSFLTDMIGEQILQRRKHWYFLGKLKSIINSLPAYFNSSIVLDGLRILINGKINGKDRSINHLMYKYFKDWQITKLYWISLKVDYSNTEVKSKYGAFSVRVIISKVCL